MTITHPRAKRVSGASAAPMSLTEGKSLTPKCSVADREAGSPTDRPASHLGYVVVEALTVLGGLAVFGAIAWFFLVLA